MDTFDGQPEVGPGPTPEAVTNNEVDHFEQWRYCPEKSFMSYLDRLKEDLLAEEDSVRTHAEQEVMKALDRLYPPLPASQGRKRGRPRVLAQETLRAYKLRLTTDLTYAQIVYEVTGHACQHVCRVCGDVRRDPGRIGRKRYCLKCKSTVRKPHKHQPVCNGCGDACRDRIRQVEKFLADRDIAPLADCRLIYPTDPPNKF